jgi:hypothetical protein
MASSNTEPISVEMTVSEERQASVSDKKEVSVKGADQALAYISGEQIDIDPATEKRLLRKIDGFMLPWLCVLYFLQYLDKGT